MRHLLLLSILLTGCSNAEFTESENGFYIDSLDHQHSFFCKTLFDYDTNGIVGANCKDMNGLDHRVTLNRVVLKEGKVYKTKDFNYMNLKRND